jgi:hypothetical protein
VMALFRASLNNQWSLDWFRTQVVTIGNKQSTIVWQICQVIIGAIWPKTQIVVCEL